MKNLKIALLALAFSGMSACFTTVSAERLRVASWNIGLTSAGESATRIRRIRAVVNTLKADVIALQRVSDRAVLRRIFPASEWRIVMDDDSPSRADVALVVRKTLTTSRPLNAGDEQFLFPYAANSFFPARRDVLHVRVSMANSQRAVDVLVVHAVERGKLRKNTTLRRTRASRQLLNTIQSRFANQDVIVLGEFADTPDDRSINVLETGDPAAPSKLENDTAGFLSNLTEPLTQAGWVTDIATNRRTGRINVRDRASRARNFRLRNSNRSVGRILSNQILTTTSLDTHYVANSARVYSNQNIARTSSDAPVLATFSFPGSSVSGGNGENPGSGGNNNDPDSQWPLFSEMDLDEFSSSEGSISTRGQSGSVRVVCKASHYNYDDPIVFPGQRNATHLHQFFGNTLTDYTSTARSLAQTGDGTCQGGMLNRSAYWVPALLDARGRVRVPQYSLIYYKGTTSDALGPIAPFPNGMKIVVGNAMAMGPQPGREGNSATAIDYEWYCGSPVSGEASDAGRTIPTCSAGRFLTLSLIFPRCGDGRLDSANHKSHMAYPAYQGAPCPASHPIRHPQLTYNIHWNNNDGSTAGWKLSSDMGSVAGGTSTHADWLGAWHPAILQEMTRECINSPTRDCKGGTVSPTRRLNMSDESFLGPDNIYERNQPPTILR